MICESLSLLLWCSQPWSSGSMENSRKTRVAEKKIRDKVEGNTMCLLSYSWQVFRSQKRMGTSLPLKLGCTIDNPYLLLYNYNLPSSTTFCNGKTCAVFKAKQFKGFLLQLFNLKQKTNQNFSRYFNIFLQFVAFIGDL